MAPQGIEETLYHLAVANAERPIAFAGIGSNFEEAIRPGCLDLDGARIAFSAIGIMTGDQPQSRAGPNKAGQASYRDRPDFVAVVDKLVAMPPTIASSPSITGSKAASCPTSGSLPIGGDSRRRRRGSISSSATTRMWRKAWSSTANR